MTATRTPSTMGAAPPRLRLALSLLATLTLASCGSGESSGDPATDPQAELAPAELFTWADCGIEFAPPAGWSRQRLQTSLEGVSFRVARVPPGSIDVGYYRSLHRSHTVKSVATGAARRFEPAPEDFTLDDVVDRVCLDPSTLPEPETVVVQPYASRVVGGLEALSLDYSWDHRGDSLLGRDVYVAAGDCLFVVRARGTESDLEVFERVVATLHFPDSGSMQ